MEGWIKWSYYEFQEIILDISSVILQVGTAFMAECQLSHANGDETQTAKVFTPKHRIMVRNVG